MEGVCSPAAGRGCRWLGAGEERLDRALVAGLLLDAALEGASLPSDPQARSRALKMRVQEALLANLAGHITLDRFRDLIRTLERSFSFYLALVSSLLPPAELHTEAPKIASPVAGAVLPASRAVLVEPLQAELERLRAIFPQGPRRKLSPAGLQEFLQQTGGAWFKLRHFQEHFNVDRKTAWEYLQKFLQAGLLTHNRGRAAAVRYALEDKFLKVKAGPLRREVAARLADLASSLAPQMADRLILSAGEPFWEEELGRFCPAPLGREILNLLTGPDAPLEVVCAPGAGQRLLRLKPAWRQSS